MGILSGKKALIVGVASKHSIAYGIAEAFAREGAELAFTYQNEKLQSRVEKFAEQWGSTITLPCDVASDEEIENVFTELNKHWDNIDIIIHAVGFAPAHELNGNLWMSPPRRLQDCPRHQLLQLRSAGQGCPQDDAESGNLLTLSYLGAERVLQNYNVMGGQGLTGSQRPLHGRQPGRRRHRVNGFLPARSRPWPPPVSPASAVCWAKPKRAPLRRNVTTIEVGNAAAFMSSDLASGITGEVLYVDAGANISGMGSLDD